MIGKKLKYLIKSSRHKQIDLAKYLGISPSRLSNYLSDKREPDLAMLAQMVKFLGSDLNSISGINFAGRNVKSSRSIKLVDEEVPVISTSEDVVLIQHVPMNAKKRGINSVTFPINKALFEGVENPEVNGYVFQVNGYVPEGIAKENDYLICAKCSATSITNGNKIFENGRNAKFFKFYKDEEIAILINEDDNKDHIRVDDIDDLNNYFKIIWVLKKI